MIARVLVGTALLVLLVPLFSWGEQQVVEVRVNDRVPAGKTPSLVIEVRKDVRTLTLDLQRDDGVEVHRTLNNVPRNSKRSFDLPQEGGLYHYTGTVTATLPSGESGSMNVDFGTEVVTGLCLEVKQGDLNLAAQTLLLQACRALAKIDYTITGEDGSKLGQGTVELKSGRPPYQVDWQQKEGTVLKIVLLAYDLANIHAELELVPWSYSIPHEEVEFETGRAEIRPEQAPKLDGSFKLLGEGLEKFGKLLRVKLFIAGHTDTVSGSEYNQNLSEQRALAIARYFRAKGFKQPVFFQGFGERALKVSTPDETPDPRNRRAEYLLAAEPPSLDIPGAEKTWKRL